MRPVTSPPRPFSSEIICSTGPPGANCTTKKLIAMMPNNVGITSSNRRSRYAPIRLGLWQSKQGGGSAPGPAKGRRPLEPMD